MKKWNIPVEWGVYSQIEIEADTLEEAIIIAKDDDGVIPLPTETYYIDGSWRLCYDESDNEVVRKLFNDNQKDGG